MAAAMPRIGLVGGPPSARAFNTVDDEVAALGTCFHIARTISWERPEYPYPQPPNVDWALAWQTYPTVAEPGMFSLATDHIIRVVTAGTYLLMLQVRYATVGPTGVSGSASGWRYARIMLNGTSPGGDTIVNAVPRPGSMVGDGTTVQAFGVAALEPGDALVCGWRHSASTAITSLNTDAGGTYFSMSRLGPGAPS